MILPKPLPNEKLVIWAVVLRVIVFAAPFTIFCVVVLTTWALRNLVIVLDSIAYFLDNSVVRKYAHQLPSTIVTKP